MNFSRSWYGSPSWTVAGLIAIPVIVLAISYVITSNMPDLSASCLTGDQSSQSELFEPGLDVLEVLAVGWAGLMYWLTLQYQVAFAKRSADAKRQLLSFAAGLGLFGLLLVIYFFWAPDCLKAAAGQSSEISVGPSFGPGNLITNNFWLQRGIDLSVGSLIGIQIAHWSRSAQLSSVEAATRGH